MPLLDVKKDQNLVEKENKGEARDLVTGDKVAHLSSKPKSYQKRQYICKSHERKMQVFGPFIKGQQRVDFGDLLSHYLQTNRCQ